MPDIVITPNRGTSTNPKIDFTGVTTGTIKLEVLTDGSLSFNGANGSLFSIADSVTGSLMSVNDTSGLPILEVFSTDRVVMGKYNQNTLVVDGTNGRIGIGTGSPTDKLTIAGTNSNGITLNGSNSTITASGTIANLILGSGTNTYIRPGSGYSVIVDSGNGLQVTSGDIRTPTYYISSDTSNRFASGALVLRGQSPTIWFRDTDNNSAMIHVNSNIFYVLRGANDTETWTQVGGVWPLEINLTNNNATFGGTVTGTRFISNIATGTAPLAVTSTTLVTNLNADLLDGLNSASTNTASTIVSRDSNGDFAARNITATNFYANDWYRNNAADEGLYNEVTTMHWYSSALGYWDVAPGSGTLSSIRLRTGSHNGTIRGYLIANSSNDIGFYSNDGNWKMRIVGGDYTIFDGTSVRAQLFYDSNNTNFYVDPASTSVLEALRTSYTGVNNGASGSNGNGLSLYGAYTGGQPTYGVMFQQTASYGTFGNVTADWATYFTMNSTANRGWIFRDVSTPANVAAISNAGLARFKSLGINTDASATAGEIRATDNITAYYSDERLKTKLGPIENPIEKIKSLSGFYFAPNDTAMSLGYQKKVDVGVSAQQVNAILPEIIAPAPIDPQYMTVRYEKLIPLLIEAIKAQQSQIESLQAQISQLTSK